jgi:hypothetical protein
MKHNQRDLDPQSLEIQSSVLYNYTTARYTTVNTVQRNSSENPLGTNSTNTAVQCIHILYFIPEVSYSNEKAKLQSF